MGVRLGLDAKLYRNAATFEAPNWNEITAVKDVTLNLEAGEADVSTRGAAGWRATVATLKDGSIEFEMVWDTDDPDFGVLRNTFLNRGAVELAVMDGPITTSGSEGLRALCVITNFSRNEPLEEAVTVSVTAKPTLSVNPPSWMEIP